MKIFVIPTHNKDHDKVDKKISKLGIILNRYFATLACSFFILSLTYRFYFSNHSLPYVLKIDAERVLHVVSKNFLSVALDSSIIKRRWRNFDMNSTDLLALVSALSPAYFRLGGTASDCLIFNSNLATENFGNFPVDGGLCMSEGIGCEAYHQNFTMSAKDWLEINKFTKSAGLELLFDLNVLLRKGKAWDPSNAVDLVKFSKKNGLTLLWQLGNEPNSFQHVFNRNVSGTQLAKDFVALRNIFDEIYGKDHVMLVGPDITRPRPPGFESTIYLKYFIEEIRANGKEVIDAITWHHYYLNGRVSEVEDFINPSNFNFFLLQMNLIIDTVLPTFPDMPIWLTETSDAYGGGAPNITNRFMGGFLWLDKLGLAAAHGLQVVTRQSIFGGYYSLIDEDLKPLPDYWISVLHKKLVGTKVLGAQLGLEMKNGSTFMMEIMHTLRFYCHCTPSKMSPQNKSGITIFGLNIGQSVENVDIKGVEKAQYRDVYILTGEDGLQSRYTLLNGKRLEMDKNGELPVFHPEVEDKLSPITLPPYSMGFWVYHGVRASVCD